MCTTLSFRCECVYEWSANISFPHAVTLNSPLFCHPVSPCRCHQALLSPTTAVEVAIALPQNDTSDGLNSFYFYEVSSTSENETLTRNTCANGIMLAVYYYYYIIITIFGGLPSYVGVCTHVGPIKSGKFVTTVTFVRTSCSRIRVVH